MSEFSVADHRHMARVLNLARMGLTSTHPNPRVGCVLVVDDEVIGEGWHARAGEPHAEVYALQEAGTKARGSTAYVNLEPCAHTGRTPPCADALIEAGIARVVVATQDPYEQVAGKGLARLRSAGVTVETGLMAAAARELNAGFFSRIERGRPWLRLKLAGSLDGVNAMASGESQWITSPQARADGHQWRAKASAVMTGSGTLLADNPRLTARVPDAGASMAIVVDSRWRMPADAAVVAACERVLWMGRADQPVPTWAADHPVVEAVGLPGQNRSVALGALLTQLSRMQVNEVQVEAGARLSGALLLAGLVDEVLLYMAPMFLGSGNRGLLQLPGLESLAERINLQWIDSRRIGADLRLRLRPVRLE